MILLCFISFCIVLQNNLFSYYKKTKPKLSQIINAEGISFSCIVLYCIVLYCIVLYCIVLYCIVLYCIVLYCIVLYCIVLYCIVLYCIVLYCIVLYLTDILRQREEYEVIYGTRRNAECHITSVLRAGEEYLFYFMTNSRYIFVTK